MRRIQLMLVMAIMVVSAIGGMGYSVNNGAYADLVPLKEEGQNEIYVELLAQEAFASTTTLEYTSTTTSTTRKESVTTTTTTVTTTMTTTEEVVPVAVEETFNEEVCYADDESNFYSVGERDNPEEGVTDATWNRAEWPEEWLPSFAYSITYSDVELQMLYNVVQHEVGDCSQRSKYIVTSCVINRVVCGWGYSLYDVITARDQFTGIEPYLYRTDYASQDTIDCVNYVLTNGIDFGDGATSFYNPRWCGYMSWFENQELVGEYEGHRYFRKW